MTPPDGERCARCGLSMLLVGGAGGLLGIAGPQRLHCFKCNPIEFDEGAGNNPMSGTPDAESSPVGCDDRPLISRAEFEASVNELEKAVAHYVSTDHADEHAGAIRRYIEQLEQDAKLWNEFIVEKKKLLAGMTPEDWAEIKADYEARADAGRKEGTDG